MLQAWPGDGACRPPDIIARERRWLRPNAEAYRRPDADDLRYGSVRPPHHRGHAGPPAQAPVTGKGAGGYSLRRDGAADRSSAEIPTELLRLRAAFSGLRVSVLLLRLSLRGGFKPDQPRVPAGNPDGGQWTAAGSASGGDVGHQRPTRLHGLPKIPRERPPKSSDRTAAVKLAARVLKRLRGRFDLLVEAARWLYEHEYEIVTYLDPPATLEQLQNAVGDIGLGYQIHHIVEQSSASKEDWSPDLIHGRENLVRIPTIKHREISAWFARRNKAFGNLSPREYLRGKDWAERRRVGLDALVDHGVLLPWRLLP